MVGAGAWLLGAVAATAGSLLAVSMLGRGITSPGRQLTPAMVSRALASQAAGAAASPPAPAPSPSVQLGGVALPITRATRAPGQDPAAVPAGSPGPASAVLSSPGGTAVALCDQDGAYLQSWSPQQGFGANAVARGPTSTARVSFTSAQAKVTMLISCPGGVPSAAVHTTNRGGGGDE